MQSSLNTDGNIDQLLRGRVTFEECYGGLNFSLLGTEMFYFLNFWRTWVLLRGHWYQCFGLLVNFALFFNVKMDPCLHAHPCAMDLSNSRLAWHLLTSWWPAWQLGFLSTYSYTYACKNWWDSNPRSSLRHSERTRLYMYIEVCIFAGSWESAYSLIWGAHRIWGQGLGTFMISRPI